MSTLRFTWQLSAKLPTGLQRMQVVWIGSQEYGFIEQQVWLAGNPPPPPPPSPPPPPGPPSPPPPPPVGIMPQLNFTAIYQSTQISYFQHRRAHSVSTCTRGTWPWVCFDNTAVGTAGPPPAGNMPQLSLRPPSPSSHTTYHFN